MGRGREAVCVDGLATRVQPPAGWPPEGAARRQAACPHRPGVAVSTVHGDCRDGTGLARSCHEQELLAPSGLDRMLDAHRSGDSGSPRPWGSTSASSAPSRSGSRSVSRVRPPPGRRMRPAGSRPLAAGSSSSAKAVCTVCREAPVARAIAVIPPRPSPRAQAARPASTPSPSHLRALRAGSPTFGVDPSPLLRVAGAWLSDFGRAYGDSGYHGRVAPRADWFGCGWSEALLDALLSTTGMVDLIAARCPQR